MSTGTIVQVARYLAVLFGGFIVGGRLVSAIHAWREWHTWAGRDPSGADAYRSLFVVDLGVIALTSALAGLIWWLLRPRPLR